MKIGGKTKEDLVRKKKQKHKQINSKKFRHLNFN